MARSGRGSQSVLGQRRAIGPRTARRNQPGIQFRFLHGRKTLLVKMEPGTTYPSHPHAFDEHCLVIDGVVADHSGMALGTGDFLFMPAGSTHGEIFTDTGCTFLIAYS